MPSMDGLIYFLDDLVKAAWEPLPNKFKLARKSPLVSLNPLRVSEMTILEYDDLDDQGIRYRRLHYRGPSA